MEMIQNEIKVLKNISHPNIIKLLDSFELKTAIVLVYEYCDGGNANDYILQKGPLTESKCIDWVNQMVQALNILDSMKVVHRDIKLENVFVQYDPKNCTVILKLGDFGLCSVNPDRPEKASIGSPAFIAPECLSKGMYTVSSDIYALGVMMHEVFIGKLPFKLKRTDNILQ